MVMSYYHSIFNFSIQNGYLKGISFMRVLQIVWRSWENLCHWFARSQIHILRYELSHIWYFISCPFKFYRMKVYILYFHIPIGAIVKKINVQWFFYMPVMDNNTVCMETFAHVLYVPMSPPSQLGDFSTGQFFNWAIIITGRFLTGRFF